MSLLVFLLGMALGVGIWLVARFLSTWQSTKPRRRAATVSRRRTVFATIAGLATSVLTGWPVAGLLVGSFVLAAPELFGSRRAIEREIARTDAMASWAENLRDTFVSGQGLHRTLIVTAEVTPLPIRREVGRMAQELQGRERLEVALHHLAQALADPTADLMVASLILAEQGQVDKIGDLLSALARTAREEASMQRRVQAGRARVHTAAAVVTGTLVVFFVGLTVFARGFLRAYDSWTGQFVLGVVGLVFGVSLAVLNRMARRLVSERVLFAAQGVPPESVKVAV